MCRNLGEDIDLSIIHETEILSNPIYLFIYLYLFLAVLGLRFCARAFFSCDERGPLFIAVRGPFPLPSTGSRRAGSVVVAHGLSCSAACGIFPDQGSNPCLLHWQADSQPLRHQGSPKQSYLDLMQQGISLESNLRSVITDQRV